MCGAAAMMLKLEFITLSQREVVEATGLNGFCPHIALIPVDSNALVVTLDGKPISAFYASSTGGATQNVKDVWGSSIAYLQGVPDPWSLDTTINPRFAFWERVVLQKDMALAMLGSTLMTIVYFYKVSLKKKK